MTSPPPHALHTLTHAFFEAQGCFASLPISRGRLRDYMQAVQAGYGDLPYHSIEHVLSVVQAAIAVWEDKGLGEAVRATHPRDGDLLALAFVVAAAVHDLDHSGLSNDYLVRSGHRLAIRYNDFSPNESHHLASAFELMSQHDFARGLGHGQYRLFRETVLYLVMHTDMARHQKVVSALTLAQPGPCDTVTLMAAALKCADLTHVFLPSAQQEHWSRRLQLEHVAEGDRWEEAGWKRPRQMARGRESAEFSAAQMTFLNGVVVPFMEVVVAVLPLTADLLEAARQNGSAWQARLSRKSAPRSVEALSAGGV